MATLDSDVPMVPVGEASSSAPSSSTKKPKRFEIKKWSAVALWAWDIVVDNCAICRNHIMDLSCMIQYLSAFSVCRGLQPCISLPLHQPVAQNSSSVSIG
ncbi:hypothetical protein DITRI_Ditri10aG0093100 [Diplodiscus trichospermus]